jgi:hypothetical protein
VREWTSSEHFWAARADRVSLPSVVAHVGLALVAVFIWSVRLCGGSPVRRACDEKHWIAGFAPVQSLIVK